MIHQLDGARLAATGHTVSNPPRKERRPAQCCTNPQTPQPEPRPSALDPPPPATRLSSAACVRPSPDDSDDDDRKTKREKKRRARPHFGPCVSQAILARREGKTLQPPCPLPPSLLRVPGMTTTTTTSRASAATTMTTATERAERCGAPSRRAPSFLRPPPLSFLPGHTAPARTRIAAPCLRGRARARRVRGWWRQTYRRVRRAVKHMRTSVCAIRQRGPAFVFFFAQRLSERVAW